MDQLFVVNVSIGFIEYLFKSTIMNTRLTIKLACKVTNPSKLHICEIPDPRNCSKARVLFLVLLHPLSLQLSDDVHIKECHYQYAG
jgi:hypothetical protein